MRKNARLFFKQWTLLICLLGFSSVAFAAAEATESPPACGAEERQEFLDAANNDTPAEVLVEQFAHCADGAATANAASDDGLQKTITINNGLASTFFEQMNGCGYHPQVGAAACDVEIKRRFGYGAPGAPPLGSFEFVDFCFVCPAGTFHVPGSVHVTDDTTGVQPSWAMMAFAGVPAACGIPAGTGAPLRVIATLSWGVPAIAPCSANPTMIWGNRITFDTRDDP